jgi:transposase
MKITRKAEKINLNQILDIAVDVHGEILNFFFACGGKEYSDECRNRTALISQKLLKYQAIALENGKKNLRIVCEPTGQYQNTLFRTARRLGFMTCYVNAESVAKFRVVESNDSGKTDQKDPRVICTLAKLDKVLRFRLIGEKYLMLRKLHKIHDEIEVSCTRLRCRLSKLLVELFCDYSFKKDFLYSNSGLALVEHYGCNPYSIVAEGFEGFCKTMKQAVPRIHCATLKRLWNDAESSVLNQLSPGYVDVLESRLHELIADYLKEKERKDKVSGQMVDLLNLLREKDPNIPPPTPQVISERNLARLLAETGPLADFDNWRKLMRYAGLNIRMRQSGKFQGQNKITKKGRPLLRKVLLQIILPLVKQRGLYGQVYRRKKDDERRPGNKAMTIVARQFLRKFYGWYKSGRDFDEKRFFTSQSEYMKMATAA